MKRKFFIFGENELLPYSPLLCPLVSLSTVHSSILPYGLNKFRTSDSVHFFANIPTNNFRSEKKRKKETGVSKSSFEVFTYRKRTHNEPLREGEKRKRKIFGTIGGRGFISVIYSKSLIMGAGGVPRNKETRDFLLN